MEIVATAISWVLIAAGSFFLVVGATGIFRMPDVFTRMHAAGTLDTGGAGLMLTGMLFAAGLSLVSVKLLIILAVILFTSPVATHALAQAALHAGVEPILASKRVLGIGESKKTGGGKPPARKTPAKAGGAPAKSKAEDAGEASEPSAAQGSEATASETVAPEAAAVEPPEAAAPEPDESADDATRSESREAGASRAKRSGRWRKAATSPRRTRRSGRRTGGTRGRRRTKPSSS